MKAFMVRLTPDERIRLEQHRSRLGLRSHADVIRRWIKGPLVADPVADDAWARVAMVRTVPMIYPEARDGDPSRFKATVGTGRRVHQAGVKAAAVEVPFGPTKRATPKKGK